MFPSNDAQEEGRQQKHSGTAAPHNDPGVSMDWIQTRIEIERSQNRWFKLALSLHGFYLTTALHLFIVIAILLSSYLGFLPWEVSFIAIAVLTAVDVLVYFILKRGYNLNSRDPHLMVLRLVQLVAVMLYLQIYAGPTKLACAAAILVGFMLAGPHAKIRTMLWLNLVTVIAYLATFPAIKAVEGPVFNLNAELLNWYCFAVTLLVVVAVGGTVNMLRANLANSNMRLAHALHQVTELATTDELTKVYNRRYMGEMMGHEINRVGRGGPTFTVLLMDIDHFKRINDVHGHKVGDKVLKIFAQTVLAKNRESDLFARWGGEEFLLFMPQTKLDTACACAERIRIAIEALQIPELSADHFTVSIGAAEFSMPEKSTDLVERADRALYCAKQSGRNRVESNEMLL